MTNFNKVIRRDNKLKKFDKTKNGKPFEVRISVRMDFNQKKELMKKTGLSFQKSILKLVKDYLKE